MAVKPKNGDSSSTGLEAVQESAKETVQESTPSVVTSKSVPPAAATDSVVSLEKAQSEVKANVEKAVKTAEEFLTFGQGNVEAVLKSSQIWAAGVQDLSKNFAATAQAQFDQTLATFKALAGVKSLKEAVDLQTSLARSSLEKAVSEAGKITDASLKLAEQTLAPLSARVTLAVEKFGRPSA